MTGMHTSRKWFNGESSVLDPDFDDEIYDLVRANRAGDLFVDTASGYEVFLENPFSAADPDHSNALANVPHTLSPAQLRDYRPLPGSASINRRIPSPKPQRRADVSYQEYLAERRAKHDRELKKYVAELNDRQRIEQERQEEEWKKPILLADALRLNTLDHFAARVLREYEKARIEFLADGKSRDYDFTTRGGVIRWAHDTNGLDPMLWKFVSGVPR